MKKMGFILLVVLLAFSILGPTPAKACALCSNCKALNMCYDRCKQLFVEPTLLTSCYGGCLIGCWVSADA